MSVAPPPDPLVPIFNPLYWDLTATDGATGITPAYLNLNYLKFPYAQGLENLQNTNVIGTMTVSGTTTLNDPLQVNDLCNITGALTVTGITTLNDPLQVNDTATVTGTLTASSTVTLGSVSSSVPTCLASYSAVTPTDNTTKIPTTAWVQTAIGTVPTSNVISTQTFTGNSNITFPTNTQYATIMISGAGGNSGNAYFTGSAVNTGGGGGGGGFVYINRLPVEAGTLMGCSFTSGSASLYYLPIANTVYTGNTPIVSANKGGNGGDGSAGGAGTAGIGQGATISLTGYGIASAGAPAGAGISTSGSGQVLFGINQLGYFNQLVNAGGYGNGGYTVVNNGAGNNYTVVSAGGAVCIVVSYSS
jgi:hypothetical protein